jgi:hypothetical protein
MGSGVSKTEIENKYAKKTDLNALAKSSELANYLKSASLPDGVKTFIQSEKESGTLDTKIKDFNYIKQNDLSAEIGKLNLTSDPEATNAAIISAIQTTTTIQNIIARTMAADTQLQNAIGTLINNNPAFTTGVTNQLTTPTNISRITTGIAKNPELPNRIVNEIDTRDILKNTIANRIVANPNFKDNIIAAMSSPEFIDVFRGEAGLLDPQIIEDSVKMSVMWCADGEMCEIPKADAARSKRGSTGIKLEANQYIEGLKIKANDPLDFAQGIEAQPRGETPKDNTRGKGETDMDGTIVAKFDKSGTTLTQATNSALELHGIGKQYSDNGAKRGRKQVKVYDDLVVNGKIVIGSEGWTLEQASNGNLHIHKGNLGDWSIALLKNSRTVVIGGDAVIQGDAVIRGDNIIFDHAHGNNRSIIHSPNRTNTTGVVIAPSKPGDWDWDKGVTFHATGGVDIKGGQLKVQDNLVVRYDDSNWAELYTNNGKCIDAGSVNQGCDWNNEWKVFKLRRKP